MDVMVDLETLSNAPNAAIVAIGAVTFNNGDVPAAAFVRDTFYCTICARSAQRTGGHIGGDTVIWWLKQPDAARLAIVEEPLQTFDAISAFTQWLRKQGSGVRVWGNGANFDNVVLRDTFQRLLMDAPWSFRDDRCYRTLKSLRPDIAFEPYGTHHKALDDAFAQGRHAEQILAALKGA